MHPDEQVATIEQVTRLVADQLPQWAHLPVSTVAEFGTDHMLYRIGDDLVARMPRARWAVEQVERDAKWLPELAPHLPVDVPAPLAVGAPGHGFPWPWSVVPWLPGQPPAAHDDGVQGLGADLAAFVTALHAIDPAGGPVKQVGTRGAPVRDWDGPVREALQAARDVIVARVDPDALEAVWDDMLAAPDWQRAPVWIHGDLMPGNMLVSGDELSAVIDFGGLGLGDPAADLVPYWLVLGPRERRVFRDRLDHDEATWRRARGWAIGPAITGIPYYLESVPAFAERGLRTLEIVLDDLDSW
ncbi:MAG: aminoglycoside phosphotransferase family protein [Aeromicrobium sp.]